MKAIVMIGFLVFSAHGWAQESKENADFKLAVSLYNDKLYDLAVEQFSQFVSSYPNTQQGIEGRFYLGLTQVKLKRFEDARFTFQNFALAFPENPKAPEAWWNVAEAYVELHQPQEAALAFERVKTFHPRSTLAPSALLKASTYFDQAGDSVNTKKILRALTQEYGSADVVPEGRLRLARIYFSEQQFELARNEAGKAAEGSKDATLVPAALQLTAKALRRLGKSEDAKAALNQIVTRYRTSPAMYEALLDIGAINAEAGLFQEASAAWKQIINARDNPPAWTKTAALISLGDAALVQGRLTEGQNSFETALTIPSDRSGEAAFKAARTAERLGNPGKAGDLYMRAASESVATVDPRILLLGGIHGSKLTKRYNQLVRSAQKYAELYPADSNTPRVLLDAGETYLDDLNDARHAQERFEVVLNAYSDSPLADDALFGLARSLHKTGEVEEVLQLLQSLPKRFPASDFLEPAREMELNIQTFEQKNRDGGIKNLALLMGDVIAGKPKGEMSFRLAEIYFNDLKDFPGAAEHYATALRTPLPGQIRAMAWYHRAQSLEFASWREFKNGKTLVSAGLAITAYDSLLKQAPEFPAREEALAARLSLKLKTAKSLADVRRASDEIRKEPLSAKHKEQALLALSAAYQSLNSNSEAAQVLAEVLRLQPSSPAEARGLFLLSQSKFELGERDSAAAALETYLAKYPVEEFSAQAMHVLARYHAEKGSVTRALELYKRLEQQFPYTDAAQDLDILKADAFYTSGDVANAIVLYRSHAQRLTEVFPAEEVPVTLIAKLADCARRTGNRVEAKMYYSRFLARDTSAATRSEINYILAGFAREEGNLEAAARYLDASRAGATTPEQQQKTALEELELLLRNDDYKTALLRVNDLLGKVKNDSLQEILQVQAVVIYFRLDNLTEADKRSTTFLRAHPKAEESAAEFEFERGRYHLRKEETDPAIKRLEALLTRYPKTGIIPETIFWLAKAYEAKGLSQRSVQLYDSVLQRFPSNEIIPRIHLSLGNVYYGLEQWDAAAKQYKELLDNEERSPDLVQFAMSNLIMAYKEIGLFDAALQLTRQYIDRFPDDPDLITKRIDLGVIYQKLGYYDQSILHLQTMLENANPELEGELRYYIGEAHFYKGNYQQAILEFLKVPYLITSRTKVDWVSTSYYMAGQSYEKMSKFDQAITMYKQIIDRPGIDPTFKAAAQKEIDRVNVLVKGK